MKFGKVFSLVVKVSQFHFRFVYNKNHKETNHEKTKLSIHNHCLTNINPMMMNLLYSELIQKRVD
jgi:choline kinase